MARLDQVADLPLDRVDLALERQLRLPLSQYFSSIARIGSRGWAACCAWPLTSAAQVITATYRWAAAISRLRGSPIIEFRDWIETAVLRSDTLDRRGCMRFLFSSRDEVMCSMCGGASRSGRTTWQSGSPRTFVLS